ncbi:uncharacterized protein LOC144458715 [Epinephelus lanceolatus]
MMAEVGDDEGEAGGGDPPLYDDGTRGATGGEFELQDPIIRSLFRRFTRPSSLLGSSKNQLGLYPKPSSRRDNSPTQSHSQGPSCVSAFDSTRSSMCSPATLHPTSLHPTSLNPSSLNSSSLHPLDPHPFIPQPFISHPSIPHPFGPQHFIP